MTQIDGEDGERTLWEAGIARGERFKACPEWNGVECASKSRRRVSKALAALRVIANLPNVGTAAKVARIALADCRKIKEGK